MDPIFVTKEFGLYVTYTFSPAENSQSDRVIVLHHGICHTRWHFRELLARLNALGLSAAVIDQQSENAGWFRNCLSVQNYRDGMAAAVRRIAQDTGKQVGSYALHSMGALVGEELQQRHPELRRPTVLMAPIPVNGAWRVTLRLLRTRPLPYLKAVLTLDIHSLAKSPEDARDIFFDCNTRHDLVEATTSQLKHAPFWTYLQLVIRRIALARIRDDGAPKLLLWSATDRIFSPDEYDNTRRLYPRLEQHSVEGGHDFFQVDPQTTANHIARFHQTHAAESSTDQQRRFDSPQTPSTSPAPVSQRVERRRSWTRMWILVGVGVGVGVCMGMEALIAARGRTVGLER